MCLASQSVKATGRFISVVNSNSYPQAAGIMTLHWWMHWFWVTQLLIICASSGYAFAAPQSEELQHITTDTEPHIPSERSGRALYFSKPSSTTARPGNNTNTTDEDKRKTTVELTKEDIIPVVNETEKAEKVNLTEIVHPSIQWTAVPAINATEASLESNKSEESVEVTTKLDNTTYTNVTVLPLNTNFTEQNSTFTKRRNLTRPDFAKEESSIQGAGSESKIVTEKPLSLETTYHQTRIPPNNIELYRRVADNTEGGMDTGAIAGISFACLVLAALAGSTAFVLYRRRYLNKPQTLNDKCSNPDSSGYLDDSTIRDNSEEMYSLDNDSFLNSLEAMTIQNYWTDTVKHTKL
ncbi:hypothetical protein NE865_10550 [Phthorimaea operculella]|nr:hypothetical protein NE865_10550 [Phthorimaea operculella]